MRHGAFLVVLLLAGCAAGPRFDTAGTTAGLAPAQVTANPGAYLNAPIVWGGVIVASANLREATRLEVLAYPLDGAQRPRAGAAALGRFVLLAGGYLETRDYAPGRLVTVRGRILGVEPVAVGEVVRTAVVVGGGELYLWPRRQPGSRPGVHIGVGVVFGG